MSGYQSTELVIANVKRPAIEVASDLRGYLSRVHAACESTCLLISEPFGAEGPAQAFEPLEPTNERIAEALDMGYGVRLDEEIRVGTFRHLAMLCFARAGDQVSTTLKLESAVIDAIYRYDRSMEEFDEEAKRGLVELCLGVTNAAESEGFLLLRDQKRLSPLSARDIAAELQQRVRPWEIGGVVATLLPLAELRRLKGARSHKRIYPSTTGLTIYDLVHAVKN
jgi:hypothetical protein